MNKSSDDGDYSDSDEETNQVVDKKDNLAGKQLIISTSIKSKLLQFAELFGPNKQYLSIKISSINPYQLYCLVNHY